MVEGIQAVARGADSQEYAQSPQTARADAARRTVPGAAQEAAAGLSSVELAQVAKLAVIDRHVRAHEQAHLAAAGPYAKGGPSYSYVRGPDGNLYAVAGEVALDCSPVQGDPEATIEKARVIQAAANAPADPSTQDRMVAAAAARMEQAARQELDQQRQEQLLRTAYGLPDVQPPGSLFSLAA
jgi:hypothetical protein